MAKAQEIIENVVANIIKELESGTMPWAKPWENDNTTVSGFGLPLRHNGQAYNGFNVLALWASAMESGFKSRFWLTFNQAKELKGAVKKGSKATAIIYAAQANKQTVDESTGELTESNYSFLKVYSVFNADQIEGLPEHFYAKEAEIVETTEGTDFDIIPGQAWFNNIPAKIVNGGNKAYYSPSKDFIALPFYTQFRSKQAYASTAAHELIHWTGHESRLNRLAPAKWGDNTYAYEELIAELGAAFAVAQFGLVPAIREDHAPYIQNWINKLKADPKILVNAASKASQALQFLNDFQVVTDLEASEYA